MKTQKNLFAKIITLKNFWRAEKEASAGKRFRPAVLDFEKNFAKNILILRQKLLDKSYRHGKYKFFKIFDQKERRISAAPFADRIIHHAIYQIIEPIYDRKFIFDSFANRNGKGTHKAVLRLQSFLQKIERERERERERETVETPRWGVFLFIHRGIHLFIHQYASLYAIRRYVLPSIHKNVLKTTNKKTPQRGVSTTNLSVPPKPIASNATSPNVLPPSTTKFFCNFWQKPSVTKICFGF